MRFFIVVKNGDLVKNRNKGFLWPENILRHELKGDPRAFIGADIRETGFSWLRKGEDIHPPVHPDYGTRLLAQATDLLFSLPHGDRHAEMSAFKAKVVAWLLGN